MSYYEFGNITWLKLAIQDTAAFKLTIHKTSLPEITVEANSRISPVSFLNNNVPNIQNGQWDVLFLYNSNLSQLLEIIDRHPAEKYSVCVTWGLANVVLFRERVIDICNVFTEIKRLSNNWECWHFNQEIGAIKQIEVSDEVSDTYPCLSFSPPRLDTLEFKSVFDEYISTINGIVKNCHKYLNELTTYFIQLHNFVVNNLINNDNLSEIKIIDSFVALNASLSRVHTQLFSCCNGIVANKCPIQNHSLLGIGIASLALFKYSQFLENNLIESKVTGLLENIAEINITPSKETDTDKRINENRKQIDAQKQIIKDIDSGIPIVPFFSGRDGFRYGKISNISIPIMCLYNAHRCSWNLLTLTHELSHMFVYGTIKLLEDYPNTEFKKKIKNQRIKYPLEEQATYIDWAWSLYNATTLALYSKKDNDFHVETELEEIITHIVDFLYFYNGNVEKYMKFIWYSWLKVPSVEKRIRKYIVRTGAAILSVSLEKQRESYIKQTLIDGFTKLHKETKESIYQNIIDNYLNNTNEWAKIFDFIADTVHVIELVRVFLFDEKIAANIEKEPRRKRRKRKKDSSDSNPYDFKLGNWKNNDINISNPIFFVKNYCINDKGSEQHALWFFNKLASLELIK